MDNSTDNAESQELGPYDSRDYGERGGLLDAGSLWLPAILGASLHFTMEKSTQAVIAAVYVIGSSAMQLQAYAAPRSQGLWDQLRLDMRRSIAEQGGISEEVDGDWGKALVARVPVPEETGNNNSGRSKKDASQHRFIGIDGPRWFLKISISGSAAADEQELEAFMAIVRKVVVHRGDDPRPPKEMLDLHLPPKPLRHQAA